MKITGVKSIMFTAGKQNIDMHWHEGTWKAENAHYTNNDTFNLVGKPVTLNVNGKQTKEEIKYVFVSNLDCMTFDENNHLIKNEIDGNMEMLNECKIHPQKKPYAVCQAGYGSAENIEKLIRENPNKFVGLKFHPMVFQQDANSAVYEPYMKIAEKYNLPCLFHSDKTGSYACPKKIYELAQKFPKVPVILAHLGAGTDHQDAINVLLDSIETGKANLYGDTSWVDCKNEEMPTLKNLIARLQQTKKGDQTKRLLYGSDAPLGEFGAPGKKVDGFYADNLSTLKTMISKNFHTNAEKLSDNICFFNSKELFLDKNWAKNLDRTKFLTARSAGIILTAAALAGGLYGAIHFTLKNPNQNSETANIYTATKPQINLLV